MALPDGPERPEDRTDNGNSTAKVAADRYSSRHDKFRFKSTTDS